VTDHEGHYVKTIFDAAGNLTSLQHLTAADKITREKTWSYSGSDYPGLLFKEYEADGVTHTRTQYDASGNVRSVVDPNGNQTDYAYDAFNRVISITRPGNAVTCFEYDSQGNLAKVVDPEGDPANPALGHTTTYTYDVVDYGVKPTLFTFTPESTTGAVEGVGGRFCEHCNSWLPRQKSIFSPGRQGAVFCDLICSYAVAQRVPAKRA